MECVMNKFWIIPFAFIFGGKKVRKRLHYILLARRWWRTFGAGFMEEFREVLQHGKGNCNNFPWCIRRRLDPDYQWEVPVPEYLTDIEVTQGWLLV